MFGGGFVTAALAMVGAVGVVPAVMIM